jgi:acetamidase/formamidase/pimeloyl-ACP methyl ester carboxylesterase
MTFAAQNSVVALVTAMLWVSAPSSAAAAPPSFGDQKTDWHGFDRYDFLMDEADLSFKPYQPSSGEGNAVRTQVKGQLRCVVVAPRMAAPGNPWSWRGYYFDHEPQAEIELLKRGFHIGFIWCDASKPWDAWYAFLTEKHGLSKKLAFIGMSRGGRNAYTWATAHPDKVSCIYADNPAISREALALLGGLAKNDVPLLHICGSLDPILGNHTLVVESAYQQLGGRISVMIKDGAAHHPHSLRDPKLIADFIEQSLRPAASEPPGFVGKSFTKTSFYIAASDYREIPSEKTFAACRGPWFEPSYDRYEFRIDAIRMPLSVIVPRAPAPGKPWVFRADFVTRDAAVDLKLLGQGFHVVTGPVPADTDGPVLEQWNVVYKHLTEHGLSKTPVLEGAGGAAGEAYAWAIAHPDRVSCIYAENPILRSRMTKAQPLDRLDILAKAGVPLLHVCGSLDPWLESQTRVLEKRYRELGGQVAVILQEGAAHFPTGPRDPKPVVEFIARHQTAKAADPKPGPPAASPVKGDDPRPRTHELKASPRTVAWGYYDAAAKPALRIKSGDTVEVQTLITNSPEGLERALLPPAQVEQALRDVFKEVTDKGPGGHILTGPIHVEGAEPGDTLEVRIRRIGLALPYSYNGFSPRGGLLPEDFPRARTKIVPLDEKRMVARFAEGIEVPLRPFFGSMGVAPPPSAGRISSVPPGTHAGNLDNKELVAGTTLFIPVHAPGALFAVGDGHAAQGDGEIDITALETSMTGTLQFLVRKDLRLRWPRAETPTHYIVMGLDKDLSQAMKLAAREAIEFLTTEKKLSQDQAYMLASVGVDFHVTQVVDGTKGVHGMIPKALFTRK